MTRFFDTSAIIATYTGQPGGARARALLAERPAVSRLAEVEAVSALARLAREISLPDDRRDAVISAVLGDFVAWDVIEVTPDVTARARELLVRHVLRASDAIQLASALQLQARAAQSLDAFVTFDRRLIAAARAERLKVFPE